MNKESLDKRIKDMCYEEWGALKHVKEDTSVGHDNHHYGVHITTFKPNDFNWDFEEFVARVTLMDGYKLSHYKYGGWFDELNTHTKINEKMWFMPNVSQYFPRQKIYDGVIYGDGNDSFCFIQFEKCYMCIHGYGS